MFFTFATLHFFPALWATFWRTTWSSSSFASKFRKRKWEISSGGSRTQTEECFVRYFRLPWRHLPKKKKNSLVSILILKVQPIVISLLLSICCYQSIVINLLLSIYCFHFSIYYCQSIVVINLLLSSCFTSWTVRRHFSRSRIFINLLLSNCFTSWTFFEVGCNCCQMFSRNLKRVNLFYLWIH